MRIGIFSDTLEKKGTGIGYYTEHLLKYIGDIAKENDTIYTIDWKKGANYKDHIEVSNPFPFFKEYLWHSYCIKKLKKSDFDILHNPSQIPIFLRPNIRYVVTIHDITTIVKGETHPLSHRLFDLIAMKKTFQYANGIIADSIATKEDIIRIFDIPSYRIEVIYLAADEVFCQISDDEVDNFREQYGIRDPFILFVGTIQPRKNITGLLRAFHLLKKKGYPHKLIIIGKKGWKYKEIFEQINELDLTKEIFFMGYVPNDLLIAFYNAAEFFVYPSLHEGFGLPPLEAMKCGCPVITSNVSSLPEIVNDAGVLVDPNDHLTLSKNMEAMICDASLREEYRKRGLKRANDFKWQSCIEKTYQFYQRVVKDLE